MALNTTWRKINEFIAFSGVALQQTAFGAFLDNADMDTRDKCEIEIDDDLERRVVRDCNGTDIYDEPIVRRFTRLRLTYTGITGQILARFLSYQLGVAQAPTGGPATSEIQNLQYGGAPTTGTFTLQWVIDGVTAKTEPIAYDATASEIQDAILKKRGTSTASGLVFKSGDVTVSGTLATTLVLTFGGRFANTNLPDPTIDNTNMTGGTIDLASGTNGASLLHTLSRSSDGSLPLFSFATGDQNGSVAHKIYGDAVVESIVPNFEAGEDLQVVVVIACHYLPEKDVSFSVPACANITPIKVADCRFEINSIWESDNMFSHSIDLNNNVPTEAGFGFNDIDVTVPFVRGDEPSYNFTPVIFGDEDHHLRVIADNEETASKVPFVNYIGLPGDRVTITGALTKIKSQDRKQDFVGPSRKSANQFICTPHGNNPIAYQYEGTQTDTFLVVT